MLTKKKFYVLIPHTKRKSYIPYDLDFKIYWNLLQIIVYRGVADWDEPKTIVEDVDDFIYGRFTPDGRIIYENRDGTLTLINLDGSNPVKLPPEIKPLIYFVH